MRLPRLKIISGGQTGADRAALAWAIKTGIPHGGWCPKGRRAEDGRIPQRYRLEETLSSNYAERTDWNVRDSDGTVIVSLGTALRGGSEKTRQLALAHQKPCEHISKALHGDLARERLWNFITRERIRTLNVAGPRASEEPGVGAFVRWVLEGVRVSHRSHPGKIQPRTRGSCG